MTLSVEHTDPRERSAVAAAPSTLCEAFQRTAAVDPAAVALRTVGGSVQINWGEYADRVRRIASGLAGLGVDRGGTVALLMTNRPELHLCDTAALHLGAAPFSIYNTSSTDQIAHLFADADNRVVICERQFRARVAAAGWTGPVVCVDAEAADPSSLAALEAAGDPGFDLAAAWRAVSPDDLATLIYTSGTTGPPQGVEVTHGGLLAQLRDLTGALHLRLGDSTVSSLPSAHIVDRLFCQYASLRFGLTVTTVESPTGVGAAMPDARPTVWAGTPAVWQRLQRAAEAAMQAKDGVAGHTFADAIETGLTRVRLMQAQQLVPYELETAWGAAYSGPLAALRARLGMDRLRWALCGEAPVPVATLEFFNALGVPIFEAWGMSEALGVGTANRPGHNRLGTIGQALPGKAVRVAEDGELLLRAESVTRGYRRDPDRTARAIDADGWLHTGDLASIDAEGYVTIVDRRQEIITDDAGRKISPATIECAVKAAGSLIGTVVAIGDARPYVTALIALDPDGAAAYATAHGLTDPTAAVLAADPGVRAAVATAVAAANAELSPVERIQRFRILPAFWEPAGLELTPTMKLRRRPIVERYAAEIDGLYAEAGAETWRPSIEQIENNRPAGHRDRRHHRSASTWSDSRTEAASG